METHQLKELIGQPKLDYSNLKRVYDYLQENPGTTTSQLGVELKMGKGVYRYRDLLFHAKLINKYNVCNKTEETKSRVNSYVFPVDVNNGNNSTGSPFVNLAATLAKFEDNDIIPGFPWTKKTILERFAATFTEVNGFKETFKEISDGMLQQLAILALVANKLDAFKDMTNIHPVNHKDLEKYL